MVLEFDGVIALCVSNTCFNLLRIDLKFTVCFAMGYDAQVLLDFDRFIFEGVVLFFGRCPRGKIFLVSYKCFGISVILIIVGYCCPLIAKLSSKKSCLVFATPPTLLFLLN